jgi:hypothetical protein
VEYLVLLHSEVEVGSGARKICVALLVPLDFAVALAVVRGGEVSVRTAVVTVSDYQIAAFSERRPAPGVAKYQIIDFLRHVLLSTVEGKQKSLFALILDVVLVGCVPLILCEATDSFAELGLDQHEGVLEVVAPLVEGCCFEVVL